VSITEEGAMAVFLVTWDLNRAKPNYSQARVNFVQHLQQYEHVKDPGLDSVWFISSKSSVNDIDKFLRQRLDSDDRLIVTQLQQGTHQGWLSQSIWDWVNARL
jgi:hypothetical protein